MRSKKKHNHLETEKKDPAWKSGHDKCIPPVHKVTQMAREDDEVAEAKRRGERNRRGRRKKPTLYEMLSTVLRYCKDPMRQEYLGEVE